MGGAGGAVGIAGLAGWRMIASADGRSVAASADGSVLAVEVDSGFVGAAGWKGDLLTLRPADDPSGGMLLRAELSGIEHHVETPTGFAGRCVGTVGDTVAVCGHRVIETGRMTFEAGTDYRELIADAGPMSELLLAEPVVPHIAGHTYVLVERFASIVSSTDLSAWEHFDLPLADRRGGSFGAVLARSGVLAADTYAIAEVPDSVYEAALIDLADAVKGTAAVVRKPIPIDHGSLWGGADDGISDLAIVSDRDGTRGYDDQGAVVFVVDDAQLLGTNPSRSGLDVTVATDAGNREIRRFSGGRHIGTTALADDVLIRHRIGPDVTVAAPDGKHSLILETDSDREE